MVRTRALVVLMAVLVVAPGVVEASRYQFTAYGGYRWGGEVRDANTVADAVLFDLEFENGPVAGLIFDLVTSAPYMQLELSWDHQFTSLDAKNNTTGEVDKLGDVSIDTWHLGFLYEVSQMYNYTDTPPLRPFLGISLGGTRYGPAVESIDSEWRFSIGFMLGIKVFFTERVGVRMQGRLLTAYFNSDDGLFCDSAGRCFAATNAAFVNQFDLTAGITLGF